MTVAPAAIAADAFGRTQTGAWGTADVGGAWTIVNGAVRFSVADGKGRMTLVNPGSGVTARLDGVSVSDADLTFDVSMDKGATGSGNYVSAIGRNVPGAGFYSAKLRVLNTDAVQLILLRTMGTTETNISSIVMPGFSYTAGRRCGSGCRSPAPAPRRCASRSGAEPPSRPTGP
ncbi:hypothetical protein G7085_05195 [Tessaracoccus sp. HDW20]|uniref:hypothetical protein n=1 Tax=Tessaracoccus coleopterorum TaxID=2714950 RepID=UPI0018D3FCDF|nr:hypothetical protein [Tessaracoccus coleopterorum]NHB84226.1 hypothetical protein [Tessaracoccus coleopterorum]